MSQLLDTIIELDTEWHEHRFVVVKDQCLILFNEYCESTDELKLKIEKAPSYYRIVPFETIFKFDFKLVDEILDNDNLNEEVTVHYTNKQNKKVKYGIDFDNSELRKAFLSHLTASRPFKLRQKNEFRIISLARLSYPFVLTLVFLFFLCCSLMIRDFEVLQGNDIGFFDQYIWNNLLRVLNWLGPYGMMILIVLILLQLIRLIKRQLKKPVKICEYYI